MSTVTTRISSQTSTRRALEEVQAKLLYFKRTLEGALSVREDKALRRPAICNPSNVHDQQLRSCLRDINALLLAFDLDYALDDPWVQQSGDPAQAEEQLAVRIYRTHADRVQQVYSRSQELILDSTGRPAQYRPSTSNDSAIESMWKYLLNGQFNELVRQGDLLVADIKTGDFVTSQDGESREIQLLRERTKAVLEEWQSQIGPLDKYMAGFPAALDQLEEQWKHENARVLRRLARAEKREEKRRLRERQAWLQRRCRSAGLYLDGMFSVL